MGASEAAKMVKKMFAALGPPPAPDEVVGNLDVPTPVAPERQPAEPTVQLNLRVPASTKRRVRLLAARDTISLSELVTRAIDLYEEKYGRAPEI